MISDGFEVFLKPQNHGNRHSFAVETKCEKPKMHEKGGLVIKLHVKKH